MTHCRTIFDLFLKKNLSDLNQGKWIFCHPSETLVSILSEIFELMAGKNKF